MADKFTAPDIQAIMAKQNMGSIEDSLVKVYSTTNLGSMTSAIGDSLYGINHQQTPNAIPMNRDMFGLTFFTKPRLNLTLDNIRSARMFKPMTTREEMSLPRIIRLNLDPELKRRGLKSPLVDPQQAFIPLLTNALVSMGGWPTMQAPTTTTADGLYKESMSYVDGVAEVYSTYDITANFRNMPGDPITSMMLNWILYSTYVYRGLMVPYPDAWYQNEIDYTTRIYRLVLDPSKRFVQKIAATGACFPISAPIEAAFNYESDRPVNAANDQISIPFKCSGAIYQDPILLWSFNRTVCLHNDSMRDGVRERRMVRVSFDERGVFNHRGYPRINPHTYELEWWVSPEEYQAYFPAMELINNIEQGLGYV